MKYYIIQRKASEYNDEIYSLQDEGGTPIQVFKSREEAEKTLDSFELKELIDLEIMEWGYDADDIFTKFNIFFYFR